MKSTLNIPAIPIQPKWFQPGSYNLLFNRLVNNQDGENIPVILSKDQLKVSIIEEISLLLNTRCSLTWEDYAQQMTSILKWGMPNLYGIPDFSGFDPGDSSAWIMIQEAIQNTIRIFEPRLKNPKVVIKKFEESKQNITAQIQGIMAFENMVEPIEFSSILA